MVRKFVAAAVSAALCTMSVLPGAAAAQEYRYSGFDAPRGATATVNMRVPLGTEAKKAKPSYALSFGIGKTTGAGFDGRPLSRNLQLAELRLDAEGRLDRAQVASFDLANLDEDKRLNMMGDGGSTLWILVDAVAAGAAICFVVTECFDDDDEAVPNN